MQLSKLTNQINKIKVKNVADMPLFFSLWFGLGSIVADVLHTSSWLVVILISICSLLVLLSIFINIFYSIKNPDYLRSEEYHLKKQSIEILGDKDNLLPVNPENIVDITNPYDLSPKSELDEETYD